MRGLAGVGRRWLLAAVLVLLPTTIATASTPPAAPATGEAAPSTVEVLSGDEVTLLTTSGLRDTLTMADTAATGGVVLAGACPTTVSARLVPPASVTLAVGAAPSPVASGVDACAVTLTVDKSPQSGPAEGVLVIDDPARTAAALTATTVRTSGFWVYGALALLGIVVGLATLRAGYTGTQGRTVPESWKLEDAHVTTLTAMAAAALPLLEATDVLAAYAPQYSTAGVLAVGAAVAVLLVLAPLVFGLVGAQHRRWGYAVAAALTTAGASLQIGSVLTVLLSGSLATDWARGLLVVVAVVLMGSLVVIAAVQARRFPMADGADPASSASL